MTKKIKATVTMCICISIMLAITACGRSNAAGSDEVPLTYAETDGELYDSNVIETEEGVTILCTSNYVLGPEVSGQFLFMLSDWSEGYLEDNYDWRVKFVSNGHIYQTDFYDYDGNIIATEECNGIVTVDQEYEGTYIDKIVLHIEYEDKMFTAEFVRNGR